MKRILLLLIVILSASCEYSTYKRYYTDQAPVYFAYDQRNDLTLLKTKTIALITKTAECNLVPSKKLSTLISNCMSSANTYKFPVASPAAIDKALITYSNAQLKQITQSSNDPEANITPSITDLAARVRADILMFAQIDDIHITESSAETELDSGRSYEPSWPAFSIVHYRSTTTVSVSILRYDVKSESWLTPLQAESEFSENYDTPESFMQNIQSIRQENRLRKEENERVESEMAERERERNIKKKKANFSEVMEKITYSPLPLIPSSIQMMTRRQTGTQSLHEKLLLEAFQKSFSLFNGSITGKSISGDCVNGYGVYSLLDGTVIKGNWKNTLASGKVVIHYPNGGSFVGTFENGYAYGFCISKVSSGTNGALNIYEGFYSHGEKQGDGIYYYNSPTRIYLIPERHEPSPYASASKPYLNSARGAQPKSTEAGKVYRVTCNQGQITSWIEIMSQETLQKTRNELFKGINPDEYKVL